MNNIELPRGADGSVERFGATTKLQDELLSNYADRGTTAAGLVLATLTETPYAPTINGTTFKHEVSNRYSGYGDEADQSPDTVEEAKEVLAEFLSADVDGTKKIKLDTFSTNYVGILKKYLPERSASKAHKDAFDESLVESARRKGIEVASPQDALEIIRKAPKELRVLRFSHSEPATTSHIEVNEAISEDGRMLNTYTRKTIGVLGTYYTNYLSGNVSNRGGMAPGSTVSHRIQRRVIDLRTGATRR